MAKYYLMGVEIPFEPSNPRYKDSRCEGKHVGPIKTNRGSQIKYCGCCQEPIPEEPRIVKEIRERLY